MDRLINNKDLATIIRISLRGIFNNRTVKFEGTKWGVMVTCKKPNVDIEKLKGYLSKMCRVSSQSQGSIQVPIEIVDYNGVRYSL